MFLNGVKVPPVRINESECASLMAHASLHIKPYYTYYLYYSVIQHYLVGGKVKGRMPPVANSAVVSALAEKGPYPPMRTIPADETQLVCSYLASFRSAFCVQTVDNVDSEVGENSRQ